MTAFFCTGLQQPRGLETRSYFSLRHRPSAFPRYFSSPFTSHRAMSYACELQVSPCIKRITIIPESRRMPRFSPNSLRTNYMYVPCPVACLPHPPPTCTSLGAREVFFGSDVRPKFTFFARSGGGNVARNSMEKTHETHIESLEPEGRMWDSLTLDIRPSGSRPASMDLYMYVGTHTYMCIHKLVCMYAHVYRS